MMTELCSDPGHAYSLCIYYINILVSILWSVLNYSQNIPVPEGAIIWTLYCTTDSRLNQASDGKLHQTFVILLLHVHTQNLSREISASDELQF